MNNETRLLLDKQFDTAFAAPDGIQKLRELILTLAMQGKLVPQDPNDQPASELLKEIEAEKNRLVKEGKIKQPKPLPEIKPEELPYILPKGWEWVRLGYIGEFINGDRGKNYPNRDEYVDKGIPWINTGHIEPDGSLTQSDMNFITREKFNSLNGGKIELGDLVYCLRGATFGKTAIVDPYEEGAIASSLMIIRPFPPCLNLYLYRYLVSPVGRSQIFRFDNGSAQPNLSANSVRLYVYPLPPLAEQRRIVAKIDQLIASCDELEKLRSDRAQKLITVHTAAIARLLTAKDNDDFSTAWHFITQHFGELYSVKETVAELRKTILQLAVMGKLVPQDPNDEPASELLKAIELKKQRLAKEGKIKKSKPLPNIKSEEFPYELPNTWTWVRLGSLAQSIDYGTSMKADDDSTKVPVYRMGNIANGQLINSNFKYVDRNIDDLPRLFLQKNDILFNRTNSYELVGKTAIYLGQDDNTTFASYLIRVRLTEKYLLPTYFNMAMNSPYFRRTQIEPEVVQQCGQANFNGSKLSLTIIPLPPLAEQHRIVAKIDRLMALCDRLEDAIAAAQTKQTDLLNAVMAQV